jgi:hypothetical protein
LNIGGEGTTGTIKMRSKRNNLHPYNGRRLVISSSIFLKR